MNQQGKEVWDKCFSGDKHDYLRAATSTQEGGFLLAEISWSSKGSDKKEQSFGGSDIWLIKINENGSEEWQKNNSSRNNEEAVSAAETIELGYFVAGNVSNSKEGLGSKDALILN